MAVLKTDEQVLQYLLPPDMYYGDSVYLLRATCHLPEYHIMEDDIIVCCDVPDEEDGLLHFGSLVIFINEEPGFVVGRYCNPEERVDIVGIVLYIIKPQTFPALYNIGREDGGQDGTEGKLVY